VGRRAVALLPGWQGVVIGDHCLRCGLLRYRAQDSYGCWPPASEGGGAHRWLSNEAKLREKDKARDLAKLEAWKKAMRS